MNIDPFEDTSHLNDDELIARAKELESLFTQVFNTDAGKIVLGFIEKGLTPKSNIAGESDLYKIGVRDGRRDALYQIKKNIKG